jgi:hypothetical protein
MKDIPLSEMDVSYTFLTANDAETMAWDIMTFLHQNFKYRSEITDCDNWSFLTSSLISLLYGINTCGTIWGDVYDLNGKFLFGHYFNGFITYNPVYKNFELWICDSLNPGFVKVEKGKPIIINSWLYKIKRGNYF